MVHFFSKVDKMNIAYNFSHFAIYIPTKTY